MKRLPHSENALVVRTDFSDEDAWNAACSQIRTPAGEFEAYVSFLSDPAFDGLSAESVLSALPQDSERRSSFWSID
jgi:hypothetical protein